MLIGPAALYMPPPPDPPPPPGSSPLAMAMYRLREGIASVDDVWLCRDAEQETRNKARRESWELRIKMLGDPI